MATITLQKGVAIRNTSSVDTYVVNDDIGTARLGSVSGDHLAVEAMSGEFVAKASGGTVTLVADGLKIIFSLAKGASGHLMFLDGGLDVARDAKGVVTLGGQKLTTKLVEVESEVDSNDSASHFASAPVVVATPVTVAATTSSVDEGKTARFDVTGTAGTKLAYTLSGVDAGDVTGALSGIVELDSLGKGNVDVALKADTTTEGAETLSISVGGKTASTTVNDASLTAAAAATVSTTVAAAATSVDEGKTARFDVTGTASTKLAYTLSGVDSNDVTGALSGTIDLDSLGKGNVDVALKSDTTTEGAETLSISVGGKTASITVNDTSTTTTTFALTTGADTVTGTTANDTITSTNGTLSTLDEINGGAGTDSLTVTFSPTLASAGSATAASPAISGVETITLTNNADTATFNMTNTFGVTSLALAGRNTLSVTNMEITAVTLQGMSAQVTLDLATATASTAAYGLTLNMSAATATLVTVTEDTATTAQADVLTINALGNVGHGTTAEFDVSGMEQIVLSGAGNVDLNFATSTWANNYNDLTAIKASGLAGNLTLRLGDDAADLNIVAGAGADTFYFTAALGTNDTIDGGAGTDTLDGVLTGYQRPNISNVETLNLSHLTGAASASTADFRDVTGLATINLKLDTGAVLDKIGSSVVTINLNSSDTTANDLTVRYGTAAAGSNVTVNLGVGLNGVFQTAVATATAMSLGDLNMSGNSGSLSVVTNSTAKYTLDTVSAQDFTAVTINAASASLSAVSNINLGTAQTITLMAAGAKAIESTADLSAMGANSLTLDADGQSASITLGTAFLGTANTVKLETHSAMTGNAGIVVSALIFQSAAAATGALGLDTITISAAGGDVTIGSADFLSGATSISLGVSVTMGSTAVAVTLNAIDVTDIASGASASEQSFSLTISGSGSFVLNSATFVSANVGFGFNSTGLASGSNITVDLSDIDDTGTVVSAVFGAHSGSFVGGDGADNIEFGLGTMKANGGASTGADTITLNNTAVSQVEFCANASALVGVDTISGAGAGDIILFQGARERFTATYGTATTTIGSATAFSTGTATDTAQIRTASYTAVASGTDRTAVDAISIYTSNGDTYIEVLVNVVVDGGNSGHHLATGTTAATAGDIFARVVLSNKDYTAITAAFQIHQNASGLQVTLL